MISTETSSQQFARSEKHLSKMTLRVINEKQTIQWLIAEMGLRFLLTLPVDFILLENPPLPEEAIFTVVL